MKIPGTFLFLWLSTFFSVASTYTVFEENGKVGLKNGNGQVLIPAQYEALGWSNGPFSVINNITGYLSNNRWGLINLDNHRVTKAQYEELLPGDGSLLIARKKSNLSLRMVTGCINMAGKEVIPFLYDGLTIYSMRAIVFTKIGNQYKYGLIDLENKTLIPQQYQNITPMGTLRYAVLNFEGRTALFTENGKQITPFNIDSVSAFRNNYAVIHQGGQKGLIDREGQIRLEAKYRDISIGENGSVKVREADEWFFLDGQNKTIRQTRADSVTGVGKNVVKVELSEIVQLKDQLLKPITATTFSAIDKFEKGKAIYRWDNHYGVVLIDGSVLMPPLYDALVMEKGFIFANQKISGKDSWMLFDSLGVKRSKKVYEAIQVFNGKYFAVRNRGFWGALNESGEEVIACTYDSLLQITENFLVVKFYNQYGVINLKEEWMVKPVPNKIEIVGNDRYIEYTRPTTSLKSFDGRIIYFSDNRLEPREGYLLEYLPSGTIWKINMNGVIADRQVYPQEATEKIFEESEGYRAIKRNGKYGFIDSQGRLRIANRYEGVQKFSEGFAGVKILGKWGFINRHDNIAVQPVYEEVFPFKNGFALVKLKAQYGLINTQGKLVLPARFDNIEVLASRNFLIYQNNLAGLADASGQTVINPKFHRLKDLGNGYVIVERDGTYGVVTLQGISTVPLMYDYIEYDSFNGVFLAAKRSGWVEVKF